MASLPDFRREPRANLCVQSHEYETCRVVTGVRVPMRGPIWTKENP